MGPYDKMMSQAPQGPDQGNYNQMLGLPKIPYVNPIQTANGQQPGQSGKPGGMLGMMQQRPPGLPQQPKQGPQQQPQQGQNPFLQAIAQWRQRMQGQPNGQPQQPGQQKPPQGQPWNWYPQGGAPNPTPPFRDPNQQPGPNPPTGR